MNPIASYCDAVAQSGAKAIADAAAAGTARFLRAPSASRPFLIDDELLAISKPLASAIAVSDLIGRYRINRIASGLDSAMLFNDEPDIITPWTPDDLRKLFTPRSALDFFRAIMPIEVSEPLFEALAVGRAFSLAVTTSEVIQRKVARVIEDRIQTGKMIRSAPREIDEILEDAGITHRKGYGEMVLRTNVMESYRHGAWDQFNSPNIVPFFPVWQYTGIDDGRERGADRAKAAANPELPDHHKHFKKFWPRDVPFFVVRGTDISDVANCRCDFLPVDKREWARFQKAGAVLEVAA